MPRWLIGLCLSILMYAGDAWAQSAPEDGWRKDFAARYHAMAGESFAVIGNTTYAFGDASKAASRRMTGKYVFVRCGSLSDLRVLSDSDDTDSVILRSMRIINPGEPGYDRLQKQYNNGCWSREAWDAWGQSWFDWMERQMPQKQ